MYSKLTWYFSPAYIKGSNLTLRASYSDSEDPMMMIYYTILS